MRRAVGAHEERENLGSLVGGSSWTRSASFPVLRLPRSVNVQRERPSCKRSRRAPAKGFVHQRAVTYGCESIYIRQGERPPPRPGRCRQPQSPIPLWPPVVSWGMGHLIWFDPPPVPPPPAPCIVRWGRLILWSEPLAWPHIAQAPTTAPKGAGRARSRDDPSAAEEVGRPLDSGG
jgi:hypothetical protein